MHLPILAVLLLTLTGSTAGRSQDPVSELKRLETAWNEAHRNDDAATLDGLWADDLEVNVPGMAPMGKPETLAFVRTGRMRFDRYETSDLKVRVYGEAAVVTGRLQRRRTVAGQQREDDWRFTKVYARHDGRWRVVSFHASEAQRP